jgi:hypothetical protein
MVSGGAESGQKRTDLSSNSTIRATSKFGERYLQEAGSLRNFHGLDRGPRHLFSDSLCGRKRTPSSMHSIEQGYFLHKLLCSPQ